MSFETCTLCVVQVAVVDTAGEGEQAGLPDAEEMTIPGHPCYDDD
jgi:hypothetical protein